MLRSILPRAVRELAQELSRLPGIGPKTAQRLSIYLLRQPPGVVKQLAEILTNLHSSVRICQRCFNLSERELCVICRDEMRESSVICLVEDPLDVEAIEKTDAYNGLYHVLGGVLSPIDGVGPEQLTLQELLDRLTKENIQELIIGLDQNMEGEATARYIRQRITNPDLRITRLARGLPTGGDIEFADAMTLSAALSGRKTLPGS